MKYDCCFYLSDLSLVIALPAGWPWSDSERHAPFVIVTTPELSPAPEDYAVGLDVSGNLVEVMASQIDTALVTGGE